MFENVTLTELSDSELQDALDASGKGKPAIYRKPIRELLALADGKNGTVHVPWKDVNAAATKRQTVVMGLTAAVKRDENAKGRIVVRANTDDALITLIVKASA